MKWIAANYHTVMKHYEMESPEFGTKKGYEFYSNVGKFIKKTGVDNAARDFAMLMPWGTPDQVLEKCAFIRDTIDANAVFFNFSFGGMPYEDAERSLKCFAKYVLPELKKWNTEPLVDAAPTSAAAG
jgi:hypothetical protein